MRKLNILCGLMLLSMVAFGQSSSTINFVSNIKGGMNIVHTDQLWIGENADITVDGDWDVFSTQVYIHPNAKIHGKGRLVIKNPNGAVFPFGENPTVIDGSGVKIDCEIVFENKNNLLLNSLNTDDTDLMWAGDAIDNTDLYIGKDFKLEKDDGHVILGDANFVLDEDATISNYDENKYIVTNSEGSLRKENLQGEFIFPIGFEEGVDASTDYTPAKLINNGEADDFSGRVDQEVTDFPVSIEGMAREWTIEEAVEGGSYAELTLQHNRNTDGSKFANSEKMHFVTQYDGNAPNVLGGSISSTTWSYSAIDCEEETAEGNLTEGFAMTDASELSRIGFTDFYNHTKFTKAVCEKSVLAEIWKIFTAEVEQCEVQISWVVFGQYVQASSFVVERSYDGVLFMPIATVDFTPGNEFYRFFDPTAPNGKVYYRVKVVDEDDEFEYSPVEIIESKCGLEVAAVYPNPFFEDVTLMMNSPDIDAVIIYNEIGQRMDVPMEFDGNLVKIQGKYLAAANYYALVIYGDKFYTVELTKILDVR